MNEFQKIATLLAHLDGSAREQVLVQLPTEQRSQLEALLDRTTSIPAAELTELIREYQTHLVRLNSPATNHASAAEPEESVAVETEFVETKSPPDPKQLELSCSAASLVALLEDESARFASALIAHLPEDQSAELFDALPVARRERVMALLGDQRELTVPVVRELERYLHEKLAAAAIPTSHGAQVLSKLMAPPAASPEVVEGRVEKAELSLLEKLRRQMSRRPRE